MVQARPAGQESRIFLLSRLTNGSTPKNLWIGHNSSLGILLLFLGGLACRATLIRQPQEEHLKVAKEAKISQGKPIVFAST